MSKVKPEEDIPDLGGTRRLSLWPERWRWRISLMVGVFILIAGGLAWFNREQIAGDLIDDTLRQNGLEASYTIESIGTKRQVITDLVVGDPQMPDLTADRVELSISYTYGPPVIGRVQLDGMRLFGSFTDGTLSFGSLDSLLFAESDEPAGLPSLNVALVDGRAQIVSDYGVIGAKIDGEGRLDDGFEGKLAVTAPGVGVEGCVAQGATLFGDLTSEEGRLRFDGPVRLRDVSCSGGNIAVADIGTSLTLARDFGSVEGDLALSAETLGAQGVALAKLSGATDFAWAFDGELSLRHDLSGEGLTTDFAKAASVGAKGTLSSREGFARNEWTARLGADAIDAGELLVGDALEGAREAGEGTFAGALLSKFERGITRAAKNGSLAGDISVRTEANSVRLVIPEARLRGGGGDTLIALSRLSYNNEGAGNPERLSGNILTGGADLPQINARLQQIAGGDISMRMTMAQYREGENALTIPRLEARRNAVGGIVFTGMVQGEGAIPGGQLKGLELPIEGRWMQSSGLALGTRCLDVKIAGLEAYDFALDPQTISLCPEQGKALVSYRDTLKVAAQLGDVSLSASSGESPVRLTAANAILRYPGASRLEGVSASVGAVGNAVRITADTVDANFDDTLVGSFQGATAALDIVPLDLEEISGQWSFADNALSIGDAVFTLSERIDPDAIVGPRFEPLEGKDAGLTFQDGIIRATAGLHHPRSARLITAVTMRHDLSAATGSADIAVPGIRFDDGLQPDDLTPLTKGLIAFADGTIKGRGEVEWSGDDLTSTGTFSTDRFDFAAAFGPVRGVKGAIEFTDLLGMTTAPSQSVTIASVNPGIEALQGRIVYSLTDGTIINLEDGRWPFMGGELVLRPVTLDYGGGQGQSYIFEIIALDAATFVSQMELTNLGARGRFDGTIPIIFDANGNGTIQGGLLISRPPGGNVSYVGELTYEDLGTISNYAFQTLRSLDYNQMSVELNGNLAGEILTNFNIDGVRQGDGASQNFITRQLAQLPIRFKINVRSENFYLLSQVVQGFFDPTVFDRDDIRDTLGIGAFSPVDGPQDPNPAPKNPAPNNPVPSENAQRRDEPAVQPSESEDPL